MLRVLVFAVLAIGCSGGRLLGRTTQTRAAVPAAPGSRVDAIETVHVAEGAQTTEASDTEASDTEASDTEASDVLEARSICAGLAAISEGAPTCQAAALALRRDDAAALAALVDPELGVYVVRGTASGAAEMRPGPEELTEAVRRDRGVRRFLRVWPSDETMPLEVHESSDASHFLLIAGGACRHATLRFEPSAGVWRLVGIGAWGCS